MPPVFDVPDVPRPEPAEAKAAPEIHSVKQTHARRQKTVEILCVNVVI